MLHQIIENGQRKVTITATRSGQAFTFERPVVQVERTLNMLDECGFNDIKVGE